MGLLRDSNRDDLPDLAAQFRDERQSDPVIARFVAATVYVERDESGNGLLVHEAASRGRWVHAYSRPDWLPGVDVGQDVDYASMTGQHLLALVPPTSGSGSTRDDHMQATSVQRYGRTLRRNWSVLLVACMSARAGETAYSPASAAVSFTSGIRMTRLAGCPNARTGCAYSRRCRSWNTNWAATATTCRYPAATCWMCCYR